MKRLLVLLIIIGSFLAPDTFAQTGSIRTTSYIEYLGLSKSEFERKLNTTLVDAGNGTYVYYMVPGSTYAPGTLSLEIDSILGIKRIISYHEYRNTWLRDTVDELSSIYGEPNTIENGTYFTTSVEGKRITIFVFSQLIGNTRFGIIMTVLM